MFFLDLVTLKYIFKAEFLYGAKQAYFPSYFPFVEEYKPVYGNLA